MTVFYSVSSKLSTHQHSYALQLQHAL